MKPKRERERQRQRQRDRKNRGVWKRREGARNYTKSQTDKCITPIRLCIRDTNFLRLKYQLRCKKINQHCESVTGSVITLKSLM